jgi:hypothetical protein
MENVMVRPARPNSNMLAVSHVHELLGSLGPPASPNCVWISGYAVAAEDSPRSAAVGVVCGWARGLRIPTVLDLVPHAFHRVVGTLSSVEARIGRIDVVVGEYETVQSLGFGDPSIHTDDIRAAMGDAAARLSVSRHAAVVQHRVSPIEYGQCVAIDGQCVAFDTHHLRSGLRGVGDQLAVTALRRLGLLAA